MLSSRFDGYLSLIIGLHCIKNEHLYKEIDNREFEIEFPSFRAFIECNLYKKFDFFRDQFEEWREGHKTHDESHDLKTYIDQVLTRRVRSNIKTARSLIEEYENLYFSSDTQKAG